MRLGLYKLLITSFVSTLPQIYSMTLSIDANETFINASRVLVPSYTKELELSIEDLQHHPEGLELSQASTELVTTLASQDIVLGNRVFSWMLHSQWWFPVHRVVLKPKFGFVGVHLGLFSISEYDTRFLEQAKHTPTLFSSKHKMVHELIKGLIFPFHLASDHLICHDPISQVQMVPTITHQQARKTYSPEWLVTDYLIR